MSGFEGLRVGAGIEMLVPSRRVSEIIFGLGRRDEGMGSTLARDSAAGPSLSASMTARGAAFSWALAGRSEGGFFTGPLGTGRGPRAWGAIGTAAAAGAVSPR